MKDPKGNTEFKTDDFEKVILSMNEYYTIEDETTREYDNAYADEYIPLENEHDDKE